MKGTHILVLCGALALVAPPLLARPLNVDDFDRFSDVGDVQVSADGTWVAYSVGTVDRAADEQRHSIWTVRWDGTQQKMVSASVKDAHSPRWSPDGHYLAFSGSASDSDVSQIMLLDRQSGQVRTLTAVTGDIGEFAWSPDSKRLVFVMVTGAEAPPKDGAPPRPIVIDAGYFKEDTFGYFEKGQRQHLYFVSVATGKVDALTADPAFNDDHPAWSPDATRIAFMRTREREVDVDGKADLDVINASADAQASTLTRIFAPNVQRLAFSPDGRAIAFMQGQEPKFVSYMLDRLELIPAGGGAVRYLTDTLDRAVSAYAFENSGAILVDIEDDMTVYPARLDLKTGTIKRLLGGPSVINGISSAAGHTALLYTDDRAPDEIYALEGKGLRKVTRHNEALMAGISLGAVEDLKFKSRDGTEIHGLMVKPPDYQQGKKYPTLLWVHGGPSGQDEHYLSYDNWQFKRQMFAARGYVVLGINYRGGSGRGYEFAKAIFADWGHLEIEDLQAAIDHIVARGIADPDKLGIGGRSYGGILTDYMIARDDRFKAGMSIAGEGDAIGMYGSDEYILPSTWELGPPWRNPDLWMKLSYPLFHADRIHTPTLFIGQTKDFNVPVAGAEQMYQALRVLGVPTELVIYPGETHELSRPSFMRDEFDRVSAWFEHYMNVTR